MESKYYFLKKKKASKPALKIRISIIHFIITNFYNTYLLKSKKKIISISVISQFNFQILILEITMIIFILFR